MNSIAGFSLTVPGTDQALANDDGLLTSGTHLFEQLDHGIWDLTMATSRPALDRFAQGYAQVREAEGRALTPDQVRSLPSLDSGHALAPMWSQRAESFDVFRTWVQSQTGLANHAGDDSACCVDIGAGCGWLAAYMARERWCAAAVDVTVDGGDGLAAARHHDEDLLLVRAEMSALPFATNSVDLAVFNASLHYAADVPAALVEACRIVRPTGYLAVIDSPIFHDPEAGREMVAEFAEAVQAKHGFAPPAHMGSGFVTWPQVESFGLAPIARDSGVRSRFHQWRGARRAGREVAQRPQLVALSTAHGATA